MRCGLKLRCLKRGRARWRDKLQRTVRYCVPGKYYAEDTEVNHLLRQSNEETKEFDNFPVGRRDGNGDGNGTGMGIQSEASWE